VLTGHETVLGHARSLVRAYDVADRIWGAAIATATLYRNAPGGEPLVRAAGAFVEVVATRQPESAGAVNKQWQLVQHEVAAAASAGPSARVSDVGGSVESHIGQHSQNVAPTAIDVEARRVAMLRGLPTEQDEVPAPACAHQ
jgi:hypothetical protein